MIINLIILALCIIMVSLIVRPGQNEFSTPVMDKINANKKRNSLRNLIGD